VHELHRLFWLPAQAPYFVAAFFIHSVETDFGRTMAEPMALLMIACAQIPIARDTLNSTV